MFVEFKRTLRKNRGQIIGWGIGLALYSLLMVLIYSDISQIDFASYLDSFPEEILAFFGSSQYAISSPEGYLDIYFFNYMIVFLAVGNIVKLIVNDKGDGLLDRIISYPTGRSGFYWGRILRYLASQIIILGIAWLSWLQLSGSVGLDLTTWDFGRVSTPLVSQLMLFGSFVLLRSYLLPSSRLASMITGGLLVGNYLLVGLSNFNQDLENKVKYTPLSLYQGGKLCLV